MVGFSRLTYALGRAGYIGPQFKRVTEVNMTPIVGIMVPAVLVVGMALFIRLDTLLFMANLAAVIVYLLIFISGWRCSAREGHFGMAACSVIGATVGGILLSAFLFHINWSALAILMGYGVMAAVYYGLVSSRRLQADAPEEAEAAMDEINSLVRGR